AGPRAAELVAAEHHVVAAPARGPGSGAQLVYAVDRRRGGRVVQRDVALLLLVPFEHREIGDPQRLPALADQAEVLARLEPHRAQIGRAPSELQSRENLVCRLLLEKKKKTNTLHLV